MLESKVVGENEGISMGSFAAHPNKKRNAMTDSKLFTKIFLFIFSPFKFNRFLGYARNTNIF